ncbi:MAG: hypothetical protein R2854_26385 [Caldilineaceae bacterium]
MVIVGNDDVIPFFRHPDQANLANERNYVPPVRDNTASQASLKLGYVLGQDRYGAAYDISVKGNLFPFPDLPVGRLVETAPEITAVIDAYLSTPDGVVSTPTSAFVTGYDFLEDAALGVQAELEAGLGGPIDTLISARDVSPADPRAWTADQLRAALLAGRHDLIYLAGHFSAGSALAADYRTRLLAREVAASDIDLRNAVVFSGGCHSGYNIVNAHGIPGVSAEPDWAQAFAAKGALLIAGTGYQYGDTDFVEYGERLYQQFSRELRRGEGPVAVGEAFMAAKRAYLAETAVLRPIHEKSLLIATIFGLPMLKIDMPAGRLPATDGDGITTPTTAFTSDPGQTLGLLYSDLTVTPASERQNRTLRTPDGDATTDVAYWTGSAGVVTNPAEPVLPKEIYAVQPPPEAGDVVLRGVGWRGGVYTDVPDIWMLTGAATTEIRGVHPIFISDVFYPIRPWEINQFAALADGTSRLVVMPGQYRTDPAALNTGTWRRFTEFDFRLFYSGNVTAYPNPDGYGNIVPARAAPPAIVWIASEIGDDGVTFSAQVTGHPAAGIQQVWVTYTSVNPADPWYGRWQSLDLAQVAGDSTRWRNTLALNGVNPADVRYVVQAVNGVGLVTLRTNQGAYYVPGVAPPRA